VAVPTAPRSAIWKQSRPARKGEAIAQSANLLIFPVSAWDWLFLEDQSSVVRPFRAESSTFPGVEPKDRHDSICRETSAHRFITRRPILGAICHTIARSIFPPTVFSMRRVISPRTGSVPRHCAGPHGDPHL
jgi:hypothetical protein